ncbi:MAG: 30S ribosomal protein S6 [Patescibacteria group bacterium]
MMKYDFVFLLNDEAELKTLKDLVISLSGKVQKEQSLGLKNLNYPIKKQTSAHFYEWQLEIDPDKTTELKKRLGYNEKVLRYLLLKED